MHPRAERGSRINMDDQLVLVLRLYILPGRDDQDIIHIELMEILLPVIYPVHILCLRFFDQALAYIHIGGHFLKLPAHVREDLLLIFLRLQIKAQISHPVVCFHLREDIHKHLLLVRLGKGDLILDLHPLYPQIHEHAADDILCLCRCF